MPISLDLSQVTLESAAKLLEMQLGISGIRAHREKMAMSAGMQGALIGGIGGLGTGLMSSALSTDERKRWLRNALVGTALGAGVGGAVGYGSDLAKQLQTPSPVEQNLVDAEAAQAATDAAGPSQNAVRSLVDELFNPKPSAIPTAAANASQIAGQDATRGYGRLQNTAYELNKPTSPPPKPPTMQPTPRSPWTFDETTALSTGLGVGAGHAVDVMGQRRVTPQMVNNIQKPQMDRLNKTQTDVINAFNNKSTDVRDAGGYVRKGVFDKAPVFVTPNNPNVTLGPEVQKLLQPLPLPKVQKTPAMPGSPGMLGSSAVRAPRHPLPPHTSQFPPNTWQDTIKPAMRSVALRRWYGKALGGLAGFAASGATNDVINNYRNWRNGLPAN